MENYKRQYPLLRLTCQFSDWFGKRNRQITTYDRDDQHVRSKPVVVVAVVLILMLAVVIVVVVGVVVVAMVSAVTVRY